MVLDNWGSVGRWTARAPVTSHGPSGIGEAVGSAADVRDPDAAATALRRAHEEFGDIDVLISGAAGNFPASALEMSPNAFRSVVDIDLLGT